MKKTFLQQILSIFKRKTYTITPQSFREQFADVDSDSLKETAINNPLTGLNRSFLPISISYQANQLKKVVVRDENGMSVKLENSPALESRVTLKNGKRHHFYFDTLVIEDDNLMGSKSRFIPKLSAKIPFDSIEKIEIQNGGKKFSYQ